MTYQALDFGTSAPNDGETLASAFLKIKNNFEALYAGDGSVTHAATEVAGDTTCDIGAATTDRVRITGTGWSISSLGTAVNRVRDVDFAGAGTLVHNATSLDLIGDTNIIVAAGDTARFWSDASGNWKMLTFNRGASLAIGDVIGPAGATDNALARFDGATGKLIQSSLATLDDSGFLTLPNAGLKLRDTNASHVLTIAPGSDLSANRTLLLTTGDADRTLDLSAADVTISVFGASLIDDASASAARTTLGLVLGTDVQAWDADLDALAALSGTNTIYYRSGAATWTAVTIGGLLSFAGGTLNVGDAELTAIAGLTSAANKGITFTGSGTAATYDLSAFALTLLDDAAAVNARSTLGVVIGTDVQAWDTDLDAYAALSSAGMVARTGAGTASVRTITGTAGLITVTNGDGVSGDPTLTVANAAAYTLLLRDAGTTGAPAFAKISSLTDRTAFGAGDKLIIEESSGELRKIDFSDLPGAGAGIANVVEDTTPQLGGELDCNSFSIAFDDNTGIKDDSGNELLWFQKTASAVAYWEMTNAATGNAPLLQALGETNTEGAFQANGTGGLRFLSQAYFPQATLTDGASIDWNLTNQQAAIVTLGGNRTLNAPTNQKAGATYVLVIKQDGTGSRTLSWNAAYKFPAGIDPTLSTAANAVDMVCFVSDGTSLYGVPAFAFA